MVHYASVTTISNVSIIGTTRAVYGCVAGVLNIALGLDIEPCSAGHRCNESVLERAERVFTIKPISRREIQLDIGL